MNTSSRVAVVAVLLTIACILSCAAADTKAKASVAAVHGPRTAAVIVYTKATDPNLQAEADLLRQAYTALSLADHDYKGHRRDAMHQTARAGHLLGIKLEGDGAGEAPQGTSDERLREARGYLEQVRSLFAARHHRALQHVEKAISQIDTALRVA
jgi:hypothetical protein